MLYPQQDIEGLQQLRAPDCAWTAACPYFSFTIFFTSMFIDPILFSSFRINT
jgi:hypothetical protein